VLRFQRAEGPSVRVVGCLGRKMEYFHCWNLKARLSLSLQVRGGCTEGGGWQLIRFRFLIKNETPLEELICLGRFVARDGC
jgi:hypothetical protein